MRDLSLLQGRLTVEPEPGLSPLDPRLTTITDLADHQSYREAADQAAELVAEGVFDIRPITILLYQAFLEGGLESLRQGIEILDSFINANRAAVGPAKRREYHFNQRIKWLFDMIADNFRYHLAKKSSEWHAWRGTRPAVIQQTLKAGEALTASLAPSMFVDGRTSVNGLMTLFMAHLGDLRVAPPPVVTPGPASTRPSAPAVKEAESLDPVVRHVELVVSHRFLELNAKLRAFEKLIEKGEHEKAAVVSDDINTMLERFDPREYFPDLFAPFSALVSDHINVLAGHWNNKDAPGWSALNQYYRVDLKKFVGK